MKAYFNLIKLIKGCAEERTRLEKSDAKLRFQSGPKNAVGRFESQINYVCTLSFNVSIKNKPSIN